jgi:hypothetical protein
MAPKSKNPSTTTLTSPQKQLMDDASRLRSKAISTGILSSTKPDHYPCLRPSRAIVECSGQDIFKRSAHRKAKYLFAFPGRIEALAGGGTIGQLSKLDTLNPELHITFPDRDGKSGVLKLKGTLVPTKNKYLTLQCNPALAKNSSEGDSGAVICEDVFERMIVFSEAVWVGDLALNPAEIPLSLPATVGAPSSRTAAAVIDGFTYGCGKHPTKASSAKRSLDTKAVVSGGKREGEGEEEEEVEEVDELKLSQGRARRSVVGRKRIRYTEADEDDIEANEEDDQLNDDDDDEDDVDQVDDRGGSDVEMFISRPKEADAPSSSSSSSSSSLQFQKRPSFSSAGGFMLSQPSPGKDKDKDSKGKVKEISSKLTKKPKKTREEEDDDDSEDSNGVNDDDGDDDDDDDDDSSEFSFDLGRSSPPPKKKSSTTAKSSTAAKSNSKQTKPSSIPKKTAQVKTSAISKRKNDDEEEEEEKDDDVVEVTTTKRTAFRPQRQASLQKPPVYKESDNEDDEDEDKDSMKKVKSKATVKATVKTATKTKTSATKTKKPSTKSKPTIIYVDDDEEEEEDDNDDDDDDSDF